MLFSGLEESKTT
jgi:hypothetical protein